MNSPTEDLDSYVVREVVKAICAESDRQGINFVDPDLVVMLRAIGSRFEQAERVAVVRPTRDQIREAIAEVLFSDEVEDRAGKMADRVLALFGVAVSDSQPVRPTRADVVAQTQLEFCWLDDEYRNVIREIVDFLVARGWLAVSESQETPTP